MDVMCRFGQAHTFSASLSGHHDITVQPLAHSWPYLIKRSFLRVAMVSKAEWQISLWCRATGRRDFKAPRLGLQPIAVCCLFFAHLQAMC